MSQEDDIFIDTLKKCDPADLLRIYVYSDSMSLIDYVIEKEIKPDINAAKQKISLEKLQNLVATNRTIGICHNVSTIFILLSIICCTCTLILVSLIFNRVQSADRVFLILTIIVSMTGLVPGLMSLLLLNKELYIVYVSLYIISSVIASIALGIKKKTVYQEDELIGRILSTIWILLISHVAFVGGYIFLSIVAFIVKAAYSGGGLEDRPT